MVYANSMNFNIRGLSLSELVFVQEGFALGTNLYPHRNTVRGYGLKLVPVFAEGMVKETGQQNAWDHQPHWHD